MKQKRVTLPKRFQGEYQKPIPEGIERSIVTPHDHEGKKNKPLWLIWKVETARTGVPYFPVLDTVCDSEKSCRYHVLMILDENERKQQAWGKWAEPAADVYVERIPANHRFGSSLSDLQMKSHMAIWKARLARKEGD